MLELNLGFRFAAFILLLTSIGFSWLVESECIRGCDLALASYYAEPGDNLISISTYMDTNDDIIIKYNPNIITILDNNTNNNNDIQSAGRINIPFPCDCIDGDFLGHVFSYQVQPEDSNYEIASQKYANLTTYDWITRFNSVDMNRFVINSRRNVTVNCSCGDSSVSRDYGLFVTYPLRQGESLDSVSLAANLSSDLIRRYNPDADFNAGRGLVYIPGRDENGNYPPIRISSERGLSSGGAIGGITASVVAGMLLLAGGLYYGFCIKKDPKNSLASFKKAQVQLMQDVQSVTVDKSVEFSYKELSKVTDDFSLANKIGQGGFGAVFYAELRGKKAAIKKMDMKASREFLAELKVLTHVHHLNLVRLMGYCVEGSLFLVYEYIENGNLSQHLHESGQDPLPWSTRVQIALDSAQGLEYIHEHTVPVYIHRDIKSANILIDKNFRAKVADFGLAKLTEVGGASLPTRLVGTFGYMPAEYARYGTVSPKVDVYAFGVVLYELISGKKAVVKSNGFDGEAKGLVALFDEVLGQPDPKDDMVKMIDPRLGDSYHLDSVLKMAELAKACTHENPQLRPNMRSIVVALMTLLSTTMEDLDIGPFYENEILVNLMSAE